MNAQAEAVALRQPRAVRAAGRAVPRAGNLRWWLFAGFILLGSLIFHSKIDPGDRELLRQGVSGINGSWYQNQWIARLTPSDFVIGFFAYAAAVHRFRRRRVAFSRLATRLTLLVALCVAVGVATGIYHNTASPAGDWRELFVGGLFAFGLWATVMTSDAASLRFAQLFVALVTGYGALQLAEYARGGGELAFYGRTPVGDHATLEFMVAAVAISLAMLRSGRSRLLWLAGITIGTAIVMLAFRRYAWVELAIVAAFFPLLSKRRARYLKAAALLAGAGALAIVLTWSSLQWGERFASLDPTASRSTNALAATNQGHLDDIRDGLDQVRAHPVFGLGVGVLYVGKRTVAWKGAAGMVHNAPVEVWIKFGLLGLMTYALIYATLFRRLWQRRGGTRYADLVAWGVFAFFLANFFISITVYSWPFGDSERGVLFFGLLAAAFPRLEEQEQSRISLRRAA